MGIGDNEGVKEVDHSCSTNTGPEDVETILLYD